MVKNKNRKILKECLFHNQKQGILQMVNFQNILIKEIIKNLFY